MVFLFQGYADTVTGGPRGRLPGGLQDHECTGMFEIISFCVYTNTIHYITYHFTCTTQIQWRLQ